MPALTNRVVDAASVNPVDIAKGKGYSLIWDDKLPGFALRVHPNGKKCYILNYRNSFGTPRRYTIGYHGIITPTQAREKVLKLLAAIKNGADPVQEKKTRIEAETVAELCIQYMEKHSKLKKKPSSIKADQYMINKHVLPAFGTRKVQDISQHDIHSLHYKMRNTPYLANRVLELLSKMFKLAEKWGMRPQNSNPTFYEEAYKEHKRERFLSLEEISRLNAALAEGERNRTEYPHVVAAFRLLIYTGCRLGEIQTLQWDYVDFESRCLRLPDSKTGAKVVQLNTPALEVLQKLEHVENNPYVIAGHVEGQHVTDMQKPWRRIRKAAQLEDVRIHDLRHTFASVAIGMGEGLSMIGKLLGHTQIATTQRYAHLADDPQKAASERIGTALANMMQSKTAELLQFPGGAG